MDIQGVTIPVVRTALHLANLKFSGNLKFRVEPHHVGKTEKSAVRLTLEPKDPNGPGGRRGQKIRKDGKRRALGGFACWHAHGYFFEALAKVCEAEGLRFKCTANGESLATAGLDLWNDARPEGITGGTYELGNWRDRALDRRGHRRLSEACDCGSREAI